MGRPKVEHATYHFYLLGGGKQLLGSVFHKVPLLYMRFNPMTKPSSKDPTS